MRTGPPFPLPHMSLHQVNFSFNGGEITPYLAHVNNLDKHATSAARMENFLPMPFGSIRKRPGTLHLAKLPRAGRLETFTFSDGSSYVFAFLPPVAEIPGVIPVPAQPGKLVIYRPDGTIAKEFTSGLNGPADFEEPFRLQFSQINDVIDIVDPNHQPRQVRSSFDGSGGISWTLVNTVFKYPPLLDENSDETHTFQLSEMGKPFVEGKLFMPTAPDLPVQELVILSSKGFFKRSHIGAVFEISRERAANDFERTQMAANGFTAHIEVSDIAYFSTSGLNDSNWYGTFTVERSDKGGAPLSWYPFRTYTALGDRHVPVTEIEIDKPCLLRLSYLGNPNTKARGILAVGSAYTRGLVQITDLSPTTPALEGTSAICKALTMVPGTRTKYWTEGAFSEYRGYPRTIAVHDRRRVFGGTFHRPMSLWFSRTDALDDFQTGTEDDAGMFRTLAATRQSPVLWMASQRRLFIGTNTGEWVVGAESSDTPISPVNFLAREYTRFGSNTVPALAINDSVYFVERQGIRLRELAYVLERETFDAADLTRLAEHIAVDGITQMSFQQSREPFLWMVTGEGNLLSFAYNRNENLAAWARHTTAYGKFRSVAVVRNNEDDDDVFFIVERTPAAGVKEYHLEKFSISQQAHLEAGDLDKVHYVDAGVKVAPADIVLHQPADDLPYYRFRVKPHFKGRRMHYLARHPMDHDNDPATPLRDTGRVFHSGTVYQDSLDGQCYIDLPREAVTVDYGLPITSVLATLPLDIQVENGTTHSRLKRAHELKLNVLNTLGGTYTYAGDTGQLHYATTADTMDAAPALRTGWLAHILPPAHLQDLSYTLTHEEPYPFLLRAAILSWSLHEP